MLKGDCKVRKEGRRKKRRWKEGVGGGVKEQKKGKEEKGLEEEEGEKDKGRELRGDVGKGGREREGGVR